MNKEKPLHKSLMTRRRRKGKEVHQMQESLLLKILVEERICEQ